MRHRVVALAVFTLLAVALVVPVVITHAQTQGRGQAAGTAQTQGRGQTGTQPQGRGQTPPAAPAATPQGPPEYGPPKGTLVIVGGGNTEGTGIMERFIQLAGGFDAKIVVVPTAGGNKNPDGSIRPYKEEIVVASWLKRGCKNVKMLHTHDPKVADTEEFAKVLRDANAVWFDGGRQWNIVDSYAGTLTEKEFHNVLARGGVIGGSSAGATIQGDYLVRGDTSGAQVMMTKEANHQHGFAFLRKSAIDQHQNTRNRWYDLVQVMKEFPGKYLGIGLSEGTAIVVKGDEFEVIGRGLVAIHDSTRLYHPWETPFYLLWAGDAYDMKARRVTKLGTGAAPVRQTTDGDDGAVRW